MSHRFLNALGRAAVHANLGRELRGRRGAQSCARLIIALLLRYMINLPAAYDRPH